MSGPDDWTGELSGLQPVTVTTLPSVYTVGVLTDMGMSRRPQERTVLGQRDNDKVVVRSTTLVDVELLILDN